MPEIQHGKSHVKSSLNAVSLLADQHAYEFTFPVFDKYIARDFVEDIDNEQAAGLFNIHNT